MLGSGNEPVKIALTNEAPNYAADVGGEEAHSVVAAPANKAPNNADGGVMSPTNPPAGKESGNQSADAAPTNESPNIAEEIGRPPTIDDTPNEATATRMRKVNHNKQILCTKDPKTMRGNSI